MKGILMGADLLINDWVLEHISYKTLHIITLNRNIQRIKIVLMDLGTAHFNFTLVFFFSFLLSMVI